MHHQNLEQLKALRLFGMARALEELAHTRERNALSFDDQLAVLIEREAADRANLALIRFPADYFGWTGLGHQWKFVPVRRSWLSSSMQRWAMTASRSASVAK